MSERDEQARTPGSPGVRDTGATRRLDAEDLHGSTRVPPADDWREQTTPGMTPIRGGAAADPSVGAGTGWGAPGQPAYGQPAHGQPGWGGPAATAPPYSDRPVSPRRPDALAGLLLVLAGAAAGVSLLLHWVHVSDRTGLSILRSALGTAADDRGAFFSQGWWEPVVIVLGGGLLLVLGLLVLVPARAHRFLGVVALLVALGVTAAVLVPMAADGWSTGVYDLGWWFAAAVAALGLLGALKAALTRPRSRSAA
jgi:hypothetical protein